MSASGFNVIRKHSLDSTGVRIKELTQALADARSDLPNSQLETDDVRSEGRMDHSTIKLNDERLSFATVLNSSNTDFYYEFPSEPDLKYLKVWFMLDHLGARLRDTSGFKNDAYIQGHPTLRRALLDLGFQQLPNSPGTAVMLFNSGTDAVSQMDGEYVWIADNETIQFSNYPNGFSIHLRFCCLNFEPHIPTGSPDSYYARRVAAKTDDASNGWSLLVYSTGNGTGGVEFEIMDNGIMYAKRTVGYIAGMWYQVVITYDRNAGPTQTERIKIYTGGNENSVDSTFGTILSTTFNLRIGARSSGTGFFHGYIHDYRMWMDKVLTQEEVTNINQNEMTIDNIPKGHVFVVQYALVQIPLRSAIHKYSITGRITRVKAHRFNVVTRVELTNTHKWHVIQRILQTKRHTYTIVELVKRLLTVVYNQGGALISSKTHKWHTAGKITKTHTHKYNVAGPSVALTTQYIRFTKSTTAGSNITQDVTFTGGKPQAIIVWSDGTTANNTFSEGYQMYYGFSDGTSHACVSTFAADNVTTTATFGGQKTNRVISMMNTTLGTVASEATVSFIDTNTARFNWTTNDNRAVYIHCMAIWGVVAAEVKSFTYGRSTVGNQTYTLNNASLLPKLVHTITNHGPTSWSTAYGDVMTIGAGTSSTKRWNIGNTSESARTTSTDVYSRGYYTESSALVAIEDDSGVVDAEANVSSFSAGSFVLNWTNAPPTSTPYFSALVLDTGANTIIDVGSFTEPASTGTQNISVASTVDVVKGVMIFSNAQSTSGITNDQLMSVGGGTGTEATAQGSVSVGDDDVSTATRTARINRTGSIIRCIFPTATATSSTTDCEAALSALGTDQFSLNWTTRSGSRRFHYIVFGGGTSIFEVTKTKTHVYDMGGRISTTKTHKYDVTGSTGYTTIYNASDNNSPKSMASGSDGYYNTAGTQITSSSHPLYQKVPHKITVYLNGRGMTSGTLYYRILSSDGSTVRKTIDSKAVSTLGSTKAAFTFEDDTMTSDDQLELNEYLVLQIEGLTGANNYISYYYNGGDVIANAYLNSKYISSWYPETGQDFAALIEEIQ